MSKLPRPGYIDRETIAKAGSPYGKGRRHVNWIMIAAISGCTAFWTAVAVVIL